MKRGRSRRARRDAALVLSLLLSCVAASGAEAPADPDLATTGLRRLGPLLLEPFVRLRDVGYDDNIRFDTAEPQGDAIATAGVGMRGLLLMGHRGGVRFDQEVDYVAFREHTDLNHWDGGGRARGLLLLKRLLLAAEQRHDSRRERPNTEIDQRVRRTEDRTTLEARSIGRGALGWRASVRRARFGYDADLGAAEVARRLDRDETTLLLGGELRVRPKTTLLIETTVDGVRFADAAERRDTRALAVLPGVRFDPSAAVQGEIKAGPITLDAVDRREDAWRGTVGEANLAVRFGRGTRTRGRWVRDLLYSSLADNLFFVSTEWSVAWEQHLSRRLSVELLYGRGLNHYPEPVTRAGSEPWSGVRDDRLEFRQAGLRYRLDDRAALQFAARRLTRDSTDDFFDRERNVYTIGSTFGF